MKHSLLILSFACAGALASFAESPANASSTPYDKLELEKLEAETFGFTVEGTTLNPIGGDVSAVATADFVYKDGKMEVDSDAEDPVRFQTTNNNAQDIVTLDFVLDTAIIPPSVGLATPLDAKVGFAARNDGTSTNYYAYTGSNWVELSGTPKEEGESFTLKIEVDGRTGFNKARFSVDNVKLTDCSETPVEWIDCVALATNAPIRIDFVGSGKVASLTGNRLNITAEVIVIPDDVGNIKIAEDDVKAFDKTIEEDSRFANTEAFLAAEAKTAFVTAAKFPTTGLKVAEAYALGLVVKNETSGKMEAKNDGALEIKATSPKVTEDGEISLAFANVEPPANSGATIYYQLQGSKNGTDWDDIGDLSTAMPSIPVIQVGTYNFFKVVTTVTLNKDAQ